MTTENTMQITALVVDDEALGRDLVRHLAKGHADLEIVGECGSVKKAREEIRRLRPALVFLDVEMPGASGFELIDTLERDERPWVVFTTAYSRHAVKAFETEALDYLHKPFDQERFDRAMERVREKRRTTTEAELGRRVRGLVAPLVGRPRGEVKSVDPGETPADRFTIKDRGRVYFVAMAEVDYLEASGNYVELHVGSKSHLINDTMARLEAQLDPTRFLRIHRSQIVNVARIKELQPHFNGEYIVILHSGEKLKISRGYRDRARTVLGLG